MKKVKMISAALIIMLATVMFGMSGDGGQQPVAPKKEVVNVSPQESLKGDISGVTEQKELMKESETVKDQFGIDTGMPKDEFEKFKVEYYHYLQKNQISTGDRAFNTKINILKIEEFKKHGINLNKTLDMCNLYDFIIRSELIIIGTYESVEISRDMNLTYPVTFKVKVNEVIANETEYITIPETITLKGFNWDIPFDKLKQMKEGLVNKGGQHIMFLTRDDFHYYKSALEKGSRETIVTDDCFAPHTYTCLGYSLREIKDDKIIVDYEQSTLDPANYIDIDDLKKVSKKIFDINDKANFYKRSYK